MTVKQSPYDLARFAERLREERKRARLSQAAFGKLGGVSRLAQWKYENGDNAPSVDYLLALARERIDVDYLLHGRRHVQKSLDLDTALEALRLVLRTILDPSKAPTSERILTAFASVCAAVIEDEDDVPTTPPSSPAGDLDVPELQ